MDSKTRQPAPRKPMPATTRALVAVLLVAGAAGLVHLAVTPRPVASVDAAKEPAQDGAGSANAVRAEQHRRAVFEQRQRRFSPQPGETEKAATAAR